MTLPDNIQYIIERVADGEGNLPEVIAEAKIILYRQKTEETITVVRERMEEVIDKSRYVYPDEEKAHEWFDDMKTKKIKKDKN